MNKLGKKDFEEISSEVRRGKGSTVIWNLTSSRDSEEDELSFLHSHASCFVNLPAGEEGPTTRLRFYFQETTLDRSEPDIDQKGHSNKFTTAWLSLWVEKVYNHNENEAEDAVQYEIEVDLLDEKGVSVGDRYSVSTRKTLWGWDYGDNPTNKGVVKEDFIRLKETVEKTVIQSENTHTGSSTTEKFPRPENLRMRISVNPFYIHGGGRVKGRGSSPKCGWKSGWERLSCFKEDVYG